MSDASGKLYVCPVCGLRECMPLANGEFWLITHVFECPQCGSDMVYRGHESRIVPSQEAWVLADAAMAFDDAAIYAEGHDPESFWNAVRRQIDQAIGPPPPPQAAQGRAGEGREGGRE